MIDLSEPLRYCDPLTYKEIKTLERKNRLLEELIDLLSEAYFNQNIDRIKQVGKELEELE